MSLHIENNRWCGVMGRLAKVGEIGASLVAVDAAGERWCRRSLVMRPFSPATNLSGGVVG
ncbi:hypothetical protein ACFPKZ_13025 [Streptosporangium amethystogenes subsp. fukuiense]|uniref:hypothetical protein n=1 Tax=Streptosporangium amethystogenes TaxID=2002 RepID=UPI00360E472C